MKKLFIFGDSILKGVTFSEEAGRYKICLPDYVGLAEEGIEVNNLSKMGATIEYGERILGEELAGMDADSIVLLEYGGNDCDHKWKDISDAPDEEHTCNTDPALFERLYKSCVEKARAVGARVLISNLPPLDSEKYMRWISRGLNYDVILEWLGDASMLYRWHENYNRLVERIAERCGAQLVDLRGAFLTAHNFKKLISADGIHPTEDGHSLITQTLVNAILDK